MSYENEMTEALAQAAAAQEAGDHPYGSVLVAADGSVAERNRVVSEQDPSAHSEVMAIRAGAKQWGIDLAGTTLVTSYEPCPMCCGAIVAAGVSRVVIGQRRVVGEAPLGDYTVEALLALLTDPDAVEVVSGVLADDCARFYAEVDG